MADKKKKVRSVKDTPRHKVGVVLGTGFFVILCAIIVFPVFAGLLASFRPGKELIRRGLSIDLDFSTMSLDNYTYLFSGNADSQKYFMWYKNSLIITIVSVVLTLLICYFVAYGLTMYNYRLKNFLFFLVIATMMVDSMVRWMDYHFIITHFRRQRMTGISREVRQILQRIFFIRLLREDISWRSSSIVMEL